MAETTKIAWCDATFNPWIGCSKVAPGCQNCYAESDMDHRRGRVKWGPNGTRSRTSDAYWRQPLKWNREAEKAGERRRVFCASLADVFEDWEGPILNNLNQKIFIGPHRELCETGLDIEHGGAITLKTEWRSFTMNDLRRDLFALIDQTPNLDWLLLTKRPENVRKIWLPNFGQFDGCDGDYRRNVWLGCSVSDQATADAAIPELLNCRGLCPVLFVSAEPLLGPVDLTDVGCCDAIFNPGKCQEISTLNWVIIGGESGPKARPCSVEWIRGIASQCKEAEVACFVKQVGDDAVAPHPSDPSMPAKWPGLPLLGIKASKGGDPEEWPEDLRVREFPR